MRTTHPTPLRVLVPLTAVLLLGVVTAAVQDDDEARDEAVVQATRSATPSAVAVPRTTPPRTTPTRGPVPPRSTAPRPPQQPGPTRQPVVTVPPGVPASPTPTLTVPPAEPTPLEPGPPTSGTTTLDGVRLEVAVDRSQVATGEVVRVTTTVTNTRPTAVVYRPACPSQVSVRAATGANATPSAAWSGDRQTFKDLALANLVGAGNAFVPAGQLDSGRPPTCASSPGGLVDLAPGRTLVERHAWTAATAYGSAYDGQAPVTASFTFALDRPLPGDPIEPELSTVQSSAPLRLVGAGSGIVPPTSAIDAALRIPQFSTFVEQGDSAVWEPPYPAGSDLGASVTLVAGARQVYTIKLVRPDATGFVRVLADTGTPISVTVA